MGLPNDNMLLSPYQDFNGRTKCNVIFVAGIWKRTMCNKLLLNICFSCVYGPIVGFMNVISRGSNISQCVLKQNKPETSCPRTSFLEFMVFKHFL